MITYLEAYEIAVLCKIIVFWSGVTRDDENE